MGDCASRPSQNEIDEHTSETNTMNNYCFFSLPYINDDTTTDTSLIVLENKRKFYLRKEVEYLQAMAKSDRPSIPELNVEVQKGIDLENASSCINRGKPYVVVKLEPGGQEFTTFIGDSFQPYWYRLFQFKQNSFHYTHVSCSLMLLRPVGSTITVGTVLFPIKDLQNQILREGWYPMTQEENPPKIRLRVQLIHSQKLLFEKFAEVCREQIGVLNKLISESDR